MNNYKEKYIKYKKKYINLKTQLGGGILYDTVTIEDCVAPENIRIIKNNKLNKIVILLGEIHATNDVSTIKIDKNGTIKNLIRRNDPKKGYDKYLGLISKKISIAKQNIGGKHKFDPFQKVLFLTEIPTPILLLGGKNELDPKLFSSKYNENVQNIYYINTRIDQMIPKYYPNVSKLHIDIRNILGVGDMMYTYIIQIYKQIKKYDSEMSSDEINTTLQEYIDYGILNIQKYIINDESINQHEIISEFKKNYPNIDSMSKKFIGENYDKLNQRTKFDIPKRLTDIFINTRTEYTYLKEMITKEITTIIKHPKIFTDEAFKELTIDQKLDMYKKLCKDLDILISHIMDLYGLEYIYEMPNNSTSVIIAGAAHTNFIFSRLCIIDEYELLESEKTFIPEDDRQNCKIYFPITSHREIGEFNDIIKKTRDKLLSASPIEQSNFFNNLLLQFPSTKSVTSKDPTRTLIDTYGLFYVYLKIDINIVFKEIKQFNF